LFLFCFLYTVTERNSAIDAAVYKERADRLGEQLEDRSTSCSNLAFQLRHFQEMFMNLSRDTPPKLKVPGAYVIPESGRRIYMTEDSGPIWWFPTDEEKEKIAAATGKKAEPHSEEKEKPE
jgi:hypothetical protein